MALINKLGKNMNKYKELRQKAKNSLVYKVQGITMKFADSIYQMMQENNINSTELAESLKTSNAYISKVLRGEANYTVETMVKLASAVNCKLEIDVVPNNKANIWKTDQSACLVYSDKKTLKQFNSVVSNSKEWHRAA